MSVSREDVLRIAELAELNVEEDQLPDLVAQMSRILDYVAQLGQVHANGHTRPYVVGPDAARLRADEVRPAPLAIPPGDMAPAFKQGYFLVPKLDAFDGAPPSEES